MTQIKITKVEIKLLYYIFLLSILFNFNIIFLTLLLYVISLFLLFYFYINLNEGKSFIFCCNIVLLFLLSFSFLSFIFVIIILFTSIFIVLFISYFSLYFLNSRLIIKLKFYSKTKIIFLIYLFSVLILFLFIISFLILLSISVINLLASESNNKIFVIFYFLKYNFYWLSSVFWFRIAISGIIIMYIVLFFLFLGENDPYFIKKADQLNYWFFKYSDLDLFYFKIYILSPFVLVRESFTVSLHYLFDIHNLLRYSILVDIILFINFLLSSMVSVWMYDIFWYFYNNNKYNIFPIYYIIFYILILIIILNFFVAISSIFFIVYISALAFEAKCIYDFCLPSGLVWSSEIQEEEFEGNIYAMSTIIGSFTFNRFSLDNNYMKRLPQVLLIKKPSSNLILYNISYLESRNFYLLLIKDLYSFLIEKKLFKSYILIFRVLNCISYRYPNNYNKLVEFLLLIKISIIFSNSKSSKIISEVIHNICMMEVNFLVINNFLIYNSYFTNISFVYNNSFNIINRLNFYRIFRFNLNSNLPILSIFHKDSLLVNNHVIHLPIVLINSKDLLYGSLYDLCDTYDFYNYIYNHLLTYKNPLKVFISNSLNIKVCLKFDKINYNMFDKYSVIYWD